MVDISDFEWIYFGKNYISFIMSERFWHLEMVLMCLFIVIFITGTNDPVRCINLKVLGLNYIICDDFRQSTTTHYYLENDDAYKKDYFVFIISYVFHHKSWYLSI